MLQRRAKDAKLTRERLCWLGTMATKLNRNGVFKNYLGCFQVRVRLATRRISIRSAGSEMVATFSLLQSRHGTAAGEHLLACWSGLLVWPVGQHPDPQLPQH